MSSVNTTVNLNANFKKSYADLPAKLIPDSVIFAREIPEVKRESTPGGIYSRMVVVSSEQGITKAPSGGTLGAFALNSPESMNVQEAQVSGSELVLRMSWSYKVMSSSANSPNKFEDVTKLVVANSLESAWFHQEADILWGQDAKGVGVISDKNFTNNTIDISEAEFAFGLFVGRERSWLAIESAAGQLRGYIQISQVDIENRRIYTDSTTPVPVGTIAGDIIRLKADGLLGVNSFIGLHKACLTTTGTLFNVPTTYSLWKPLGDYDIGGQPLSFQKLLQVLFRPISRGLGKSFKEIEVYVSPRTWMSISQDEVARRKYDWSYSSKGYQNGADNITYTCMAGTLTLRSHDLMKQGYALIMPKASRCMEKIGSQSTPTFKIPGQMNATGGEDYLMPMPNNAGYESRLYYDTSILSPYFPQMQWITGITNPALV